MSVALMALGPHKFYVPLPNFDTPGFEVILRDTSYTWVPQGRLNKPLAMQFTGPGEDVIVIEGKLFPHHFGGVSTIASLRASATAGTPLTLLRFYPVEDDNGNIVEGVTGVVVGDQWVIRRVRDSQQKISSVGLAHKIDFSIELAAFGPDQQNAYNGVLYGN
jgi:phage protein U